MVQSVRLGLKYTRLWAERGSKQQGFFFQACLVASILTLNLLVNIFSPHPILSISEQRNHRSFSLNLNIFILFVLRDKVRI